MASKYKVERRNAQRTAVFNKYDGRCAYCGCDINFDCFNIDHIISKYEYRRNRKYYSGFDFNGIDNLNPSCTACNCCKYYDSLEVFRERIENRINILRKNESAFRLAEKYGLISCNNKSIQFYFEKLNSLTDA